MNVWYFEIESHKVCHLCSDDSEINQFHTPDSHLEIIQYLKLLLRGDWGGIIWVFLFYSAPMTKHTFGDTNCPWNSHTQKKNEPKKKKQRTSLKYAIHFIHSPRVINNSLCQACSIIISTCLIRPCQTSCISYGRNSISGFLKNLCGLSSSTAYTMHLLYGCIYIKN